MVRTLGFHCRQHSFDPWPGNSDLTCHAAGPKIKQLAGEVGGKLKKEVIYVNLWQKPTQH